MKKAEKNYIRDYVHKDSDELALNYSLKDELDHALELPLSAVFDSCGSDTLKTSKRSLNDQGAFCLLCSSERSALVTQHQH